MTQESRSTSGNQREPTPQLAREVKGMRDDSAPQSSTASASQHLVSAAGSETKTEMLTGCSHDELFLSRKERNRGLFAVKRMESLSHALILSHELTHPDGDMRKPNHRQSSGSFCSARSTKQPAQHLV